MNKRTMSAFEKGYSRAVANRKSIKANVESFRNGDYPDNRWRAKALKASTVLSRIIAGIIPDWLHDATGMGSDGGERITEKELTRLGNELDWINVELANAGDVTSAYAREAEIASEQFGEAFGRLVQIVNSYQKELSTVAPTAWNAYPELFDYKTMVLDNLINQMMPYAKVVEFADGIESALLQLTNDLDDQHEQMLELVVSGLKQNGYDIPQEYYDLIEG